MALAVPLEEMVGRHPGEPNLAARLRTGTGREHGVPHGIGFQIVA